mmetsp:Transcript_73030/g.143194  ORF Transcript_73030/g.143194 Transcript_73030/m.143194 type:complete len:107 (-) Transcript_73030:98-418(-)
MVVGKEAPFGKAPMDKDGANRTKKALRESSQDLTKAANNRLARRGGVQRISGSIAEETRGALQTFLKHALRDSTTYANHSLRKTVAAADMVHALKRQGRTIYGFSG